MERKFECLSIRLLKNAASLFKNLFTRNKKTYALKVISKYKSSEFVVKDFPNVANEVQFDFLPYQ